ncbi:MAG: rRNA maturation RNase YbeY [Pseudomonadales bacterium]|nr:rRNA maturation RNase YbeY [Pseudomonadales bacterium]
MTILTLDSQIADDLKDEFTGLIPTQDQFESWIQAALNADTYSKDEAEISLRICSCAEIQALNLAYRQKDSPTNVLSLPTDFPAEMQIPLLGDIVICAKVVADEAAEQGKTAESHWAHMTIHSILHLLGHDHIVDFEAELMEALETEVLIGLGYNNPYSCI